jgi:diguanylate cyclase (GGDEF)-like protein
MNDELKALSEMDQLTGLYNRRKIETHLYSEFTRYIRHKEVFSIILFDIDNFKSINDKYDHSIGDFLLKELGTLLKNI